MRRGFGLIGLLFTAIVIAIVGVIAYQAGWSEGFAQHLPSGAVEAGPYPYPYYYGGPHFFGVGWIFGLLFFLFILFAVLRVARFAMFGRSRGLGGGPGWMHHTGGMPSGIDERMREWHQKAHGDQPPAGSTQPPPPPVPDQRV